MVYLPYASLQTCLHVLPPLAGFKQAHYVLLSRNADCLLANDTKSFIFNIGRGTTLFKCHERMTHLHTLHILHENGFYRHLQANF